MTILRIAEALAPYETRRIPEIEDRRSLPEAPKRELKYAPNRVVRSRETSPLRVHMAVPAGHRKAPRLSAWLRTVADSEALAYLNRNRRTRILAVVGHMVALADTASRTTTPGHDTLAERVGCSVRSISADIKLLHEAGLLATVAAGRSAAYVPKASITAGGGVKGTRWGSDAAVTNERAVYVFIEPLTGLTLEVMGEDGSGAVDKVCDPTTPEECSYPTCARGATCEHKGHGSAAPENPLEALSERGGLGLWADRSIPDWPAHKTTDANTKRGRRSNELQASLTMQRRKFELRRMSAKHLAYVCRPFFEAGWGIRDIMDAMDTPPAGGRWPHDGATGIVRMGDWVLRRLKAWMIGKRPMLSHVQRDALRSAEARERAYAIARDRARQERERA